MGEKETETERKATPNRYTDKREKDGKCVVLKKFSLNALLAANLTNISIQLNAEIVLCIWHIHSLKIRSPKRSLWESETTEFFDTVTSRNNNGRMLMWWCGGSSRLMFTQLSNEKSHKTDLNTVQFSRFHFKCSHFHVLHVYWIRMYEREIIW